jgi:hypothetical protein
MYKDVVNRDFTCQSIFRRLCTMKKIEDFRFPVSCPDDVSSRLDVHLSTIPYFRMTCSSQPDDRQTDRPALSVRTTYRFRLDPTLCREASVPACIRPDLSAARLDAFQYSNSLRFFPSSVYGKIDTPSGRCGFPSGRDYK